MLHLTLPPLFDVRQLFLGFGNESQEGVQEEATSA